MENWDDYRLLLALARSGTMRSAAEMLRTTHTTVSRRLAGLEARRGKLFDRAPGRYLPTPLGEQLVEIAERMEQLSFQAIRRQNAAGEAISGVVTLSLPEAIAQYLLLDDLFELAARHPAIDLRVDTTSRFVDLDKSEADIVVRGAQQPPDHLVGRRACALHVTYYADRTYLERTPQEALQWIAPLDPGMWPDWLDTSPFPHAPIGLRIADITARHRALCQGFGLGRGACFMADPEPNLVRLTEEKPVRQQDIWVLAHPDLRHTPRIRAVADFVYDALAAKADLVTGKRAPT